jgi:nicotinate-nucleotide pyrophosphorylase (carboxylating)
LGKSGPDSGPFFTEKLASLYPARPGSGENCAVDIEKARLDALVAAWLEEDVGHGDVTSGAVIPDGTLGIARVEARQDAVVAGLAAVQACFDLASNGALKWTGLVADGDAVSAGDVLARIEGPLADILTAERTALNLLGHLSGIATLARRFSKEMEGTAATIVDTRKTTPGLRLLEKQAVRAGGASNHRFGLDDGVLIKDNHVAAAGGVGVAVNRARESVPHGLKIEVEVATLEQLDEAMAAGADVVLLDNMDTATVSEAVMRAGGKVLLEASGGITLANARAYAETGVDLISVGALTHSAPNVDVALEVEV